ncbi:MAG TPA: hypothetical protein DHV62_03515 [Elusimicrobia bacterium]|jgi:AcrR family transcriptional regulator|nr:hypothetical protein [Elusimicrobiota bacterium]
MKERIIEATKRVIIKKGYQGLKVSDIAEEAKIGKGTVYLYFRSKEELLAELVDSFFAEANGFIEQAKNTIGNGLDKLRKFIELDLAFFEKNKELFSILGQDIASLSKIFAKEWNTVILGKYLQITDSIAALIKICQKEKLIGKIEPREGTFVLTAIIHAYAALRIHGLTDQPLPKQTDKILQIFLNGVGK